MAILVGVILSLILGYFSLYFFSAADSNTHILLSLFWFNILMYVDIRNKEKKKDENDSAEL